MDTIETTITIGPAEGTALLKCIGRAMQTAELQMQRAGIDSKSGRAARDEYLALDDVLAQLQMAKREAFYETEAA